MKKISLLCAVLLLFSSTAFSEENDDSYCGTITKVKEISKKEAVVSFKEMDSFNDEMSSYQRQLPKKIATFKVQQDDFGRNEYRDFLSTLNYQLGKSGICISVNKRSKRITSVVAGD